MQLCQLRNPWGQTEWEGAWSDDDKTRWTRRMRQKLAYDPDKSGDDGLFWMTFDDFCHRFDSINLCRPLEGWHRYSVGAEWKGQSAGGRNHPHRNPQFAFTVVESCDVFVEVRVRSCPACRCSPRAEH